MPDPSASEATQAAVRDAVARERRRLSDLLHHTASQSLTAAYYQALVISRQSPDDPHRAADLAALPDLIHRTIGELREISRELDGSGPEPPPA